MSEESLQDFVSRVNGTSHLRVEYDFGDGFVRLQTSEAERRQAAQDIKSSEDIILELLRNSRDAHATHIFVATWKEGLRRFFTVLDDGDGIPPSMHEHIFEPRVTSKLDTSHMDKWGLHGRGMALFSISVNSEAAFVADSNTGLGTAISVQSNTKRLSEKRDQSQFPTFLISKDNEVLVRGPRNILRTTCEFALEERNACSVFIGSPTEIAATLFQYGNATLSAIDRAFCKDPKNLPIIKRLAAASDPEGFAEISKEIGLPLSARSARRVMNGEIEPVNAILESITFSRGRTSKSTQEEKTAQHKIRTSTVSLSSGDIATFTDDVRSAFESLARKYYLKTDSEISVRNVRGNLKISIPLEDDEI